VRDRNEFISKVPENQHQKGLKSTESGEERQGSKDLSTRWPTRHCFGRLQKAWAQSLKRFSEAESDIGVSRQGAKRELSRIKGILSENNHLQLPGWVERRQVRRSREQGRAGERATKPFPRMGMVLSTIAGIRQGSVDPEITQARLDVMYFSQSSPRLDSFSGHCSPDESKRGHRQRSTSHRLEPSSALLD